MSRIVMPTPQRHTVPSRRPTATRRSSFTDDEDAITPCSSPPPEPNLPVAFAAVTYEEAVRRSASPKFTPSRRSSASPHSAAATTTAAAASCLSSRKASTTADAAAADPFDPTDGEDLSDAQLWRRMLAIQQEFHCYNSARMSAALLGLEMGVDVGRLAPSRKCLDLINESMTDMEPQEKQRLTEWVHEHSSHKRKKGLWRRSAHSLSA